MSEDAYLISRRAGVIAKVSEHQKEILGATGAGIGVYGAATGGRLALTGARFARDAKRLPSQIPGGNAMTRASLAQTSARGVKFGRTIMGGGLIRAGVGAGVAGVGFKVNRNARRNRMVPTGNAAPAFGKSKDWKNISQYETERMQGRATARHGVSVASGGLLGMAAGDYASRNMRGAGSPLGAFDQMNQLHGAHKKNRAVVNRAYGGTRPPEAYFRARNVADRLPGGSDRKLWREATWGNSGDAERRAGKLAAAARKKELKSLGRIARKNPSAVLAGAGAGAVGVGSLMWGGGRLKARSAEHNIARLRRERSKG